MLALKPSLSNGVDSNKCCEGLGFSHFYVQSPCNPLFVDYTELRVYYMIDEGGIPSIQCKTSLKGFMKKVDDLSLIFTDFYVPAPTPRLNSTENSLQLSEVS
jgi:hypothetical protein